MEDLQQSHDTSTRSEQELLLEYLRGHDATCPACGYNVRALTRPVCPECKQELTLTVGMATHRIGWLLAAVAPGFFSGIAAMFVMVPIVARLMFGDGVLMPLAVIVDAFGWCSGLLAIMIARHRDRFLAQTISQQRWIALTIWLLHIAALGMVIYLGLVFF